MFAFTTVDNQLSASAFDNVKTEKKFFLKIFMKALSKHCCFDPVSKVMACSSVFIANTNKPVVPERWYVIDYFSFHNFKTYCHEPLKTTSLSRPTSVGRGIT